MFVVPDTHHAALSVGSRCIECHMPKTGNNAVAGEARNHTFNFISPADSIKYSVPNSCNGCHADKTPRWALAEMKKWKSETKRPARDRQQGNCPKRAGYAVLTMPRAAITPRSSIKKAADHFPVARICRRILNQ